MITFQVFQTKRATVVISNGNYINYTHNGQTLRTAGVPVTAIPAHAEVLTVLAPNADQAAALYIQEQSIRRAEQRASFNASLCPFWKDVDSRIGMDVCTPFMAKFPGHSFVAYDNGLIWSKTQATVYQLRNCSAKLSQYPAACKMVVGFGSAI